MEKLLYFWVDKSHKRATNSTGIRANWINCLLYILKVLLNLHNFPLLNRNCTELYLGPLYRSYIMVQILNCRIPERVLLNGTIWKRFSKVSCRWRCEACHLLQVFTYRNHETVLSDTTRIKLGTRRLWISFFFLFGKLLNEDVYFQLWTRRTRKVQEKVHPRCTFSSPTPGQKACIKSL